MEERDRERKINWPRVVLWENCNELFILFLPTFNAIIFVSNQHEVWSRENLCNLQTGFGEKKLCCCILVTRKKMYLLDDRKPTMPVLNFNDVQNQDGTAKKSFESFPLGLKVDFRDGHIYAND